MSDETRAKSLLIPQTDQSKERAAGLAVAMGLTESGALDVIGSVLLAQDDEMLRQSLKNLRNVTVFSSSQEVRDNAAIVTLGIAPESVKRPGTLHDTFYALDAAGFDAQPGSYRRDQAASLMVYNIARFAPEDYRFGWHYATVAARFAGVEGNKVKEAAEKAAAAFAAMEQPKDTVWVRPSFEIALTLGVQKAKLSGPHQIPA